MRKNSEIFLPHGKNEVLSKNEKSKNLRGNKIEEWGREMTWGRVGDYNNH